MPDFLKGFEYWAREKEDIAAELTAYLTQFDSFGNFALAFFVIAILAGVGEELVFRGMLQPELQRATGNIHAAIWISAILFSAIHLQFFGFVPRMLLGVMFGYLYYWSGNIIIPMLAHFVNNGFSLLMVYLYQLGIISIDLESGESASPLLVAFFTIITFGLLLYLKKFHRENNSFAS
jgi:membrane protease YdiL (CAAX protease family)